MLAERARALTGSQTSGMRIVPASCVRRAFKSSTLQRANSIRTRVRSSRKPPGARLTVARRNTPTRSESGSCGNDSRTASPGRPGQSTRG